eukprot:snap_masked-scaffold_12-processed-gene-2.14-mRNA-1 protein AED:1.00 eAED:1.00 QI:0/-1/0/0/-1/1/1/0/85
MWKANRKQALIPQSSILSQGDVSYTTIKKKISEKKLTAIIGSSHQVQEKKNIEDQCQQNVKYNEYPPNSSLERDLEEFKLSGRRM